MCKKTYFTPYKECLLICDEDKYAKILVYDKINNKFNVEKEYYVSEEFGTQDLNSLENYQFSNGMLYNNFETYLLQERGTEKEPIMIDVSLY